MKLPTPSTTQTQPAWEGRGELSPEEGAEAGVEGAVAETDEGTVEVAGGGAEVGEGTDITGE